MQTSPTKQLIAATIVAVIYLALVATSVAMGRAPCCDKANVKKGPWSPEEDAKLKSFIEHNGTGGNWITLPSKAGLKRCGKSCRLRWINYLRPDIKHGSFTEEEEKTIYRLHAQIGSRWSLIAAQLPGRTDNDIKNYWNTRLKKKLLERASNMWCGRPHHSFQIYPLNQPANDQISNAVGREGLLNSQFLHAQAYYQYVQQQQPQYYLPQQQQQQAIQDPNQTVQLPTVLQHQLHMRSIKNELVDEHQQQQAPTGGVVESERLRDIESSLRSIVDESSSRSFDARRAFHRLHGLSNRLPANGNPLSPVAVATSHHNTSPTSSCSNLSSDRNSFGVQQIVDSAFSDSGYTMYEDPAAREPSPTMLNTSILGSASQQQVSSLPDTSTPESLLATSRFEDGVFDDLSMYNRSQDLSEVAVVDRALGTGGVKEETHQASGGGSGDWWSNIDLVAPPGPLHPKSTVLAANAMMRWSIPTPRCGAENIYTSPQAQLASQSHGTQPLDGMNSYSDSFLSKLIS
ncbi:hypothetical protein Mapa_016601 [Marchantia paleacea]|nr:hypothetical protein Mapa_016601 [Marchantia paleacea]